jgi:hypothetical protein
VIEELTALPKDYTPGGNASRGRSGSQVAAAATAPALKNDPGIYNVVDQTQKCGAIRSNQLRYHNRLYKRDNYLFGTNCCTEIKLTRMPQWQYQMRHIMPCWTISGSGETDRTRAQLARDR